MIGGNMSFSTELKEEISKRAEKKEALAKDRQKFETELLLKQDELNEMMQSLDKQGENINKIKDEMPSSKVLEAAKIIVITQKSSISNLMRRLNIGLLLAEHIECELVRIGVLSENHNVTGPCNLTDLTEAAMDYWALGHIHKSQVLSEEPLVVYAGNSQGLHRKEHGPKGCYLVSVSHKHGKPGRRCVS